MTANPAKQLKLDGRIGSLEAGKDGDFVVWCGDPLDATSHADETWIEGKKYFDRAEDLAARPALEKERAELVAKAKAGLKREKESEEKDEKKEKKTDKPEPSAALSPQPQGARR